MTSRSVVLSTARETYELRVSRPDGEGRITLSGTVRAAGGEPRPLPAFRAGVAADGRVLVLRDDAGRTWRCVVADESGAIWVAVRGRAVRLERVKPGRGGPAAHQAAADEVRAPMTGLLVDVRTSTGVRVARDDVLAVMEAMKMEYRLVAPRDGIVAEVKGAAGDRVEVGTLVVRLQPAPAADPDAP